MDVGRVEFELLASLGAWSLASMAAGSALRAAAPDRPAVRAFARQQVAWGAIDAAIAGIGIAKRRRGATTDAASLRRILRFNTAMDVGYVAFGAALAAGHRRIGDRSWYSPAQALGDGLGILVQGGFLLVLDASQAARLKPTSDTGTDTGDRYGGVEEEQ